MTNLLWGDCYNVRDLGGLPTIDGRRTRSHALIRSDILARLTSTGKQALLDYGISTVIDLRWPDEVAEEPSAFAVGTPQPGEPAYRILPVENRNAPDIEQIDSASSQAKSIRLPWTSASLNWPKLCGRWRMHPRVAFSSIATQAKTARGLSRPFCWGWSA